MPDSLGRGRHLASPAFPDDDGSAVEGAAELLVAIRDGDDQHRRDAVTRLASMRLLVAVVAVLDEAGDDGSDKSSHMAVVSMVNADGRKGLLAFTSTGSMAGWDPAARPVAATARDVAGAAIADGVSAVVIDVAGPHRTVVEGRLLQLLTGEG